MRCGAQIHSASSQGFYPDRRQRRVKTTTETLMSIIEPPPEVATIRGGDSRPVSPCELSRFGYVSENQACPNASPRRSIWPICGRSTPTGTRILKRQSAVRPLAGSATARTAWSEDVAGMRVAFRPGAADSRQAALAGRARWHAMSSGNSRAARQSTSRC